VLSSGRHYWSFFGLEIHTFIRNSFTGCQAWRGLFPTPSRTCGKLHYIILYCNWCRFCEWVPRSTGHTVFTFVILFWIFLFV
jgi:hypothetical protein